MLRTTTFAGLGLALLAQAVPASPLHLDTAAPGLSFEGARSVSDVEQYATLPNGQRVMFDGLDMLIVNDDGSFFRHLHSVAAFRYPSFVLLDPTGAYALIGESSRGKIFKVALSGAGAHAIADLDFNYDAVFETPTQVLVSAAPCGFSCGSEIYRLDVLTGALSLVCSVSGPSGPVEISEQGELYYGLQPAAFGAPCSIVVWNQTQLQSGAVLLETDATVFVPTLDGASSMRFEPVYGHLFVASPVFGGTSQVLEYDAAGTLQPSVIQSPDHLSKIEFFRTAGPGSFQAFQPKGVLLKYRGTDFTQFPSPSEVRTVRARRPRAFTSGPGLAGPGNVTFTVRGAHPTASFRVIVGHRNLYNPSESTYDAGTYLFHTGIPLDDIRRLSFVNTDANGEGSFTFHNPGNLQGTLVLQALIRDPSAVFIGSSTEAFN